MLRETSTRIDFATEFRLLKEKGGVFDLFETIVEHQAPENIDLALQEFSWLTSQFARPGGFLRKTGFNYEKLSGGIFEAATKDYIDDIVDYTYPMSWHYQRFKASYFQDAYWQFSDRLLTTNHRKKHGRFLASAVNDGVEELTQKTANYIEKIVQGIRNKMDLPSAFPLGLHNSVPPFSNALIDRAKSFIPGLKMIITDRDPRDIYLNYPKDSYSRYLPSNLTGDARTKAFCRFYRSLRRERSTVSERSDVLFLNMEDICMNPEARRVDIFNFIEVDINEHQNRLAFFNPEKSLKNVGMWKHVSGDGARANAIIEEELPEFLYDH
jgi:hypothetical protein